MNSTLKSISFTSGRLLAGVCLLGILSACSSSSSSNDEDDFVLIKPDVPVEQQQPRAFALAETYNDTSPYKSILKDCYRGDRTSACTFSQLPLLGQLGGTPTIAQIMDRVVVTHDWMGVRFEQYLSLLPAEALTLYKPVSVISIGSENGGVNYNAITARMSIGPEYLWLTTDEKKALSADGGSSNGGSRPRDELQFLVRNIYEKDGLGFNNRASADERELDDIFTIFARDMYEALAFAANFFPASTYTVDRPLAAPFVIFDEVIDNDNEVVTGPLYANAFLTTPTSLLTDIANVYYDDLPARDNQKLLTAADMGGRFEGEGKPTFWSHNRQVNDVQTLFTLGMLKYKHGTSINVMFLEGTNDNDDAIIGYGVKNRLAAALVAPRAKFVMEKILGSSTELDEFFQAGLGQATPIQTGTTYGSLLDTLYPFRLSNTAQFDDQDRQ